MFDSATPMRIFGRVAEITMLAPVRLIARHRTLRWVNENRANRGLPPLSRLPRGRRNDPGDCVIARALVQGAEYQPRVSVSGERATIGGVTYALPNRAKIFVNQFDRGFYRRYATKEQLSRSA